MEKHLRTYKNQATKLEMIAKTNTKLFRGYKLKEQLRLALKLSDIKEAKAELKSFFWRATHSRIQVLKYLGIRIVWGTAPICFICRFIKL